MYQGFSKFNGSVKENVGVGDIQRSSSQPAIENAINLAGADVLVAGLPNGLRTKLDTSGFDSTAYPLFSGSSKTARHFHGLSGGEVGFH